MAVKSTTKRSARPAKGLPIAIIGGGPAGMTAAQTAAKDYKNVILYDKNPIPGKKLGSAKTSAIFVSEKLAAEDAAKAFGLKKDFVLPSLKSYGWEKVRAQLSELGFSVGFNGDRRLQIPPGEAATLSARLKEAVEAAGVVVKKSSRVSDIIISKGKVSGVVVNGVTHPVAAVIVASGSFSSPKLGSTKDGYAIAEKAGHEIVPLKVAMVGFQTAEKFGGKLSDFIIKDCLMTVHLDDEPQFSDRGDIAFTEYGVDGDLILTHSLKIIELLQKGAVRVHLDLMPDMTRAEVEKILGQELLTSDRTTVWEILTRYVPDKMLDAMHTMIRVHCRKPAVTLSTLERKLLAIWLKDFAFTIVRQLPFNQTKGVFGGVSVDDIDPRTMRSKKIENLYFAGDVLDLLGPWGGFNIGMAFSTGYLAGLSAAKANGAEKAK